MENRTCVRECEWVSEWVCAWWHKAVVIAVRISHVTLQHSKRLLITEAHSQTQSAQTKSTDNMENRTERLKTNAFWFSEAEIGAVTARQSTRETHGIRLFWLHFYSRLCDCTYCWMAFVLIPLHRTQTRTHHYFRCLFHSNYTQSVGKKAKKGEKPSES